LRIAPARVKCGIRNLLHSLQKIGIRLFLAKCYFVKREVSSAFPEGKQKPIHYKRLKRREKD
jgi:hypothetical protein